MDYIKLLDELADKYLSIPTILMFLSAVFITLKTRFIQIRGIKKMFLLLYKSMTGAKAEHGETIQAHKALFTAMSTTLGLATMAAPVVTIQFGGPGALFYFLLSNIFGSALVFSEVTFALKFRKKLRDGTIMGGPMQYLKECIGSVAAVWYAVFTFLLMLIWSGQQSSILAGFMKDYYIPNWLTGALLSAIVTVSLIGGIKRIGNISEKMVPFMFLLYSGACLYIVLANAYYLPKVFSLIFRSAMTPRAMVSGTAFGGFMLAFRTGILKGTNGHEAGIGTATIPHSMADTKDPSMQGLLSMISTYSHGFLSLLTGLVVMLTGTWQASEAFGISAISTSFFMYFSYLGPLILAISGFLFGFGTILGNSYNGGQCYTYITGNRYMSIYYVAIAVLTFIGAIAPVKSMWLIPDFFLVLVALPNIIGILILSFKQKELLND